MQTNLLTAVYLAKKYNSNWRAEIARQLKVQTMYPHGVHPGAGNRAKKRQSVSALCGYCSGLDSFKPGAVSWGCTCNVSDSEFNAEYSFWAD
jgi:hypothetical protein